MGVTGLWTVVNPIARPTKLETLNRKRLAVDASIWIYQFLKAVRDKEGNALRNSHVVGFFRRICKLLYFGIKPVFVFDGGAPVLKRETIRKRARRREGRRDDAARTAGKLLAVQVARAAEEEAARQKRERERTPEEEEILDDQELVYVDEIGMDKKERLAGRTFKKKDQYHLPDLEVSLAEMGAPNDPRVMSQAELEEYAMQFHTGEDINLYDFSKIDFDGPFFQSLPPGDKYNILNAARLRSRLRMGYSKEQLDGMFPDRMAFSRFQIERVKERNELTQRLMHISGMNPGEWDVGGRIAGERGKEYVLVRNEGVEGGWALGVVSNKRGRKKEDAIDVDEEGNVVEEDVQSDDEDDDFEDVAIEGINRIPQSWKRKRHETREVDYDMSYEEAAERIAKKRRAVYDARKKTAEQATNHEAAKETNRLVSQSAVTATDGKANESSMFLDQDSISDEDAEFENVDIRMPEEEEEDDDLQRAIAMSLEQPEEETNILNDEPFLNAEGDDNDDNALDIQAALAESRKSKYKSKTNVREKSPPTKNTTQFQGPLPFESLNLGQSLLGKKKAKKVEESISGGFDRDAGEDAFKKKQRIQPMPNWFAAANTNDDMRGIAFGDEYDSNDHVTYGQEDKNRRDTLRKQCTREVINVEDDGKGSANTDQAKPAILEEREDWNLVDDEMNRKREEADQAALEAAEVADSRRKAEEEEREKRYQLARQIAAENEEPTTEDVAQNLQVKPPPPPSKPNLIPEQEDQSGNRAPSDVTEMIEWSESEQEDNAEAEEPLARDAEANRQSVDNHNNEDDDLFEDVEVPMSSPVPVYRQPTPEPPKALEMDESLLLEVDEEDDQDQTTTVQQQSEEDFLADDSDEELMRQLAIEAEEHDRFASSLNNNVPKTAEDARRDYENELKQLRNQQKKDRRDADEVTQTMITECQALLSLFGLPYITAPMEAEAQCAELVHLGLVDGIVTDDSDIFLFGGTRIYKNMFNAAKFVECYLSSDLEKEYALDRRKLIRFAHLLGSDYTEGIPGIGPVTALEIISDFDDLTVFKEWTLKLQLGTQLPSAMEDQLTTPFRRKFKKTVQKKLFLPTVFPDLRVDQAYLEPEVDSNSEQFQWGVPDLDKLRSFLMATIGWSQERTDEILVPVVRDMNKREAEGVQSNLTRFFSGSVGVGGRGINGANGRAGTNGGPAEAVEGTAPRNRTGKESGRMKNAYIRLRGEAEKKRRAAMEDGGDFAGEAIDAMNTDDHDETDRITTDDNFEDDDVTNDGDDNNDMDDDAALGKRRKKSNQSKKPTSMAKSTKQRNGRKAKA